RRGFNVKLGTGGIREIEFIAQALQLAFGGADPWLRSPHTLISISRLADRRHISEAELTQLSTAYEFLRRTEHILQMENGVQTHTVPFEPEKRDLLARRITFATGGDLERNLKQCTESVHRIYTRVFGQGYSAKPEEIHVSDLPNGSERTRSHLLASIQRSDTVLDPGDATVVVDRLAKVSPHFAAMLAANPRLAARLPDIKVPFAEPDYDDRLIATKETRRDLSESLAVLRQTWSELLLEIAVRDVFGMISIADSKRLQTALAEASIAAALGIVDHELTARSKERPPRPSLAVLALGKLGGRGLDYDSDLDLVLVYDESRPVPVGVTPAEFYSRTVELFVTTVSAMTRDGNLYRIDLRLRPYGSKGLNAMPGNAFLEYMRETAVVWEMLAFVKLRAVGGDVAFGGQIERETRRIIHERAAAIEPEELRSETLRVRHALEKLRVRPRRSQEIDIKYGAGGMLDVYFAVRYLQLRDDVPDNDDDRSTSYMLDRLTERGSLTGDMYSEFKEGYHFLATLDHNLRLTIGRTTRIPLGNQDTISIVASRMGYGSPAELIETLTIHRLNIRSTFESIMG
ncbi:MAG: hypothetical protein ABIV21_08390, partial [Pyrinomonadaceae bacterium]